MLEQKLHGDLSSLTLMISRTGEWITLKGTSRDLHRSSMSPGSALPPVISTIEASREYFTGLLHLRDDSAKSRRMLSFPPDRPTLILSPGSIIPKSQMAFPIFEAMELETGRNVLFFRIGTSGNNWIAQALGLPIGYNSYT